MTKFYVDVSGNYIGGFDGAGAEATLPPGATEVATPPEHGVLQTWDGAQWNDVVGREDIEAETDMKGSFEDNRVARLLFEINYDQESRLRVLEGLGTVTKVQYRDALKALLKTL